MPGLRVGISRDGAPAELPAGARKPTPAERRRAMSLVNFIDWEALWDITLQRWAEVEERKL